MNEFENDARRDISDKKKPILAALLITLVLVLGWYLIAPMLGIAITIGVGLLMMIVVSIILFGVVILLFHLFAGLLAFMGGGVLVLWSILAIFLFPIMFPIMVPLLVFMLVIGYFSRRKQ